MRRATYAAIAALLAGLIAAPAAAREFVVTFGGDVNFARSRTAPHPDHVSKFGILQLEATTEFLAREWDGDLNFINVETVVSDRDGAPQPKTFVFRSHPDQFRHLISLGVNAFSLANNHAYDHGRPGMEATLAFFRAEDRAARPLLHAGIGAGAAALAPSLAEIGGVRVAMSAIGIGPSTFGPEGGRIGMALWRDASHYDRVLAGLAEAEADLKILSIHQGLENQIALDWGARDAFRRAIDEAGVHLVLGHHPHVARAVEAEPARGAAIFHSLGNLLFVGGAVRDGLPVGQDYGMFGKAYFEISEAGVRLSALEVVPLVGVHLAPRPMGAWRLDATLRHLAGISRTAAGAAGVSFSPLGQDRGGACFGPPYGPRAQAMCCRLAPTLECDLPDLM